MKNFDEIMIDCTKNGRKIKKNDYLAEGKYPIIDQGQQQCIGYSNEEQGLFTDVPAIIFGDHTRIVKYIDKPFFLGADGIKVLRCKNSNADYRYLYYAVRNARIENTGYNRHFKWLKESKFRYPELEQQYEIASILWKVERIIELKEKELEELDILIKSRFVEIFGESGEEVPLTDYVWFQEGPGVRSVDFRNEGCILLTGSNINNNEITFGYNSDRFISNELAEGKYSHFICDEGDILVVTSAIAPEKFDEKVVVLKDEYNYCLNTGIIRFKPNHKYLTNGYFREFLKSIYFKRQVMCEMRGIAQMHFGPSHLSKMTILLPDSLEKQIEFENFIQHIDKLKYIIQKSLDETQQLFDALMQEYFG